MRDQEEPGDAERGRSGRSQATRNQLRESFLDGDRLVRQLVELHFYPKMVVGVGPEILTPTKTTTEVVF